MEVIGQRELCFFQGVARGAVVPGEGNRRGTSLTVMG
jgi:glutamine amidotransferase-like uncharacterized protein